jgi:hypothetical protein
MISFLKIEEQHQHTNGGGWVANTAKVEETAYIGPNARVYGDAKVYGYALVYGDAQVYGDAWENSPLYIQGSRHPLTNCAYGKIAIGCQAYTFAEWKKNYKAIGKAAGYTPAQIKEYAAYIALIVKLGKKSKKENK